MENNLVVKSNKLVQARYKLNLNEQKLILYAVSKLDREKDKFNILRMHTSEFMKLLDTSQFRYTEIKELVSELMKKQVSIETEKSDLTANWVSSVEYLKNLGIIELEFSEKLTPYLLQLKEQFTRYELKNVLLLKNKHSIRIYELMKQYQTIGKRQFELENLKSILFIENQYERIYDFKRFVLNDAMEEINEHTDITISFEDVKKGRRVVGFIFTISGKIYEQDHLYDIEELKLKMGLNKENFSSKQIIAIYELAIDKVQDQFDTYEYVRLNYLHIKDKARNRYGYLMSAVENDYAAAAGQLKFLV